MAAVVAIGLVGFGAPKAHAAAEVKGGAQSYTGGSLGGLTNTGPSLGVNLGASSVIPFGFEANYEGARIPLTGGTGDIYAHKVDGLVKVSPLARRAVRPYFGAGVGANYSNANDEAVSKGLRNSDWGTEIPAVAGIDFGRFQNLNFGARGTYRFMTGQDIAGGASTTQGAAIATGAVGGAGTAPAGLFGGPSANNVDAAITIGGKF